MQDQEASANVGRAGEYLALSRLSLAGYFCSLAQFQDHDAYIQTDTRILTLQIKTASGVRHSKYQFYTRQGDARQRSDIYAFVALDIDRVFWCRGNDPVIRRTTTRIRADVFNDNMQEVLSSFI